MKSKLSCIRHVLVFSVVIILMASSFSYASVNDDYWKEISEDSKLQIEKDSTICEPYFYLGVSYAYLGQLELAIDAFAMFEAIDIDFVCRKQLVNLYKDSANITTPDSTVLRDWSYLAFAYYLDYEYAASIDMFNRLIDSEPQNVWHYAYLAYVYFLVNKVDEGIEVLQAALKIEPKNEYLRALLALAYYEKGWKAKAVYELMKAPRIFKTIAELGL